MKIRTFSVATLLATLTLLCACGEQQGSPPAIAESASANLTAADPQIAAIYARSCRSCHTIAATGAPLTGDTAAWAPRMEKGLDTLVNNVVTGVGGMPPFGLCMDCDAAQLEALILFMAGAETSHD